MPLECLGLTESTAGLAEDDAQRADLLGQPPVELAKLLRREERRLELLPLRELDSAPRVLAGRVGVDRRAPRDGETRGDAPQRAGGDAAVRRAKDRDVPRSIGLRHGVHGPRAE